MAIRYQIKAQVIDLSADRPRATDRWLLDTNVLYWTSYSNASYATGGPKGYQLDADQSYLKQVTEIGGTLFWCGLSLAELAHRIESTEFEIARSCGATNSGNAKEYRHNNHAEWLRVVGEIAAAWDVVGTLGQPLAPRNHNRSSHHSPGDRRSARVPPRRL